MTPSTGWQPIETAPKDGTRILVCGRCGIDLVRWSDEANYQQFEERPGWQLYDCEDGYYSIALEPEEVTHWMPLPEEPK